MTPRSEYLPPDEARKPGSFVHSVLDDAGLTPAEFRIFCHILRRGNPCWASVASMSAHCRMHKDTTRNAIQALIERGMIQRTDRQGKTAELSATPQGHWLTTTLKPEGSTPPLKPYPSGKKVGHPSPKTRGDPSGNRVGEGNPLKGIQRRQSTYICPDRVTDYSGQEIAEFRKADREGETLRERLFEINIAAVNRSGNEEVRFTDQEERERNGILDRLTELEDVLGFCWSVEAHDEVFGVERIEA